ncbi:MAG: hypothetical protein ACI9W2_004827 [Gammaproteobacteria bacterium]|jgi:hypothetical protein
MELCEFHVHTVVQQIWRDIEFGIIRCLGRRVAWRLRRLYTSKADVRENSNEPGAIQRSFVRRH